jgi:hypothetical protein
VELAALDLALGVEAASVLAHGPELARKGFAGNELVGIG